MDPSFMSVLPLKEVAAKGPNLTHHPIFVNKGFLEHGHPFIYLPL